MPGQRTLCPLDLSWSGALQAVLWEHNQTKLSQCLKLGAIENCFCQVWEMSEDRNLKISTTRRPFRDVANVIPNLQLAQGPHKKLSGEPQSLAVHCCLRCFPKVELYPSYGVLDALPITTTIISAS